MSTHHTRVALFRSLHVAGRPLVLFNIWDAGSAAAVAAAGASALATGSWSVAAANGLADGEQMPLALVLEGLRRITAATTLPVSADLEAGYGDDPDAVGRTVAQALDAGAVGCNLEDGIASDGTLRDTDAQCARLAGARAAAGRDRFFINARTDVFLRAPRESHAGLVDDALARARAYAGAGADGLFVPGLVDAPLIARVIAGSPLPVNVMVTGDAPSLADLAALGVARVGQGPGPYIAAMQRLEAAARDGMR